MSTIRMMGVGESYFPPLEPRSLELQRGKVRLEVKRAFTALGCAVTVYGWPRDGAFSSWGRAAPKRVPLARVILASSTPKDEIRTCMESLLVLTLQRLGTSEYHLRTKMRV